MYLPAASSSSIREAKEPIAIIGMGCRFPGGSDSPKKLWDLLKKPYNVATEIPPERFNIDRFYHPDGQHHGTCNVKETYFLEQDIRHFDHAFFGIPPGEAAAMDPQQRLLMETVYLAMESAGLTIPGMQGSDTAAYVGVMCMDYTTTHALDLNYVPLYNGIGVATSNVSARLSYFFDWHGPCMTIDTACSSSLVALHEAVQTLRAGRSRIAVAAGSNLIFSPQAYISESNLGMLSPTGRSRMWDAKADGYARGEGVACLILKRLSDALADGDRVQCVIRETGINQDGRTKGITMPSAIAQAELIRATYARAGLNIGSKKDRPQYFEAHGTGTPAGDPQEAEAIFSAFMAGRNEALNDTLYVGSVKTVIGHTEGTAGLAGVIKACLAMQEGVIPPNLHFDQLNPSVVPFYQGLQLVTAPQPWPALPAGIPRRSSINSFGFGGTNAHVIIETLEAPLNGFERNTQLTAEPPRPVLPFTFSATSEKSLRALVQSYETYLKANDSVDLRCLAYTLSCRRSALPYKTAFSAASQEALLAKLQAALAAEGQSPFSTRSAAGANPPILGVFTGQGAQWARMGAQLLQSIPYARRMIEELEKSLASLPVKEERPQWTIMGELLKDSSESRLADAAISHPVTVAVQILLVNLLRMAGVNFHAVVGHSSGEIAAAYAAGILSQADAIRIGYYRGFHAHLAVGPDGRKGGMIAVGTSIEDARDFCELDGFQGRLAVAASNSATSVTISGDIDAIEEAETILEEEGKFVRRLGVDKAYHSHHMRAASEPLLRSLEACKIQVMRRPAGSPTWFSSIYEGVVMDSDDCLRGQYWIDSLGGTVLFSQAVETALRGSNPFQLAIEVGPHPSLKGPASDTVGQVAGHAVPYTSTLSRGKDDVESFVDALGTVWTVAGSQSVDFARFQVAVCDDAHNIEMLYDLPSYPWDHDKILWSESRYTKLLRQQPGRFHDLLGTRMSDGTEEEYRWRNSLTPKELPWLSDHRLQGQTVFPAMGYVTLAFEAALEVAGDSAVQLLELADLIILKGVAIDNTNGTETLVSLTDIRRSESDIKASFAFFSAMGKDSPQLSLNATGRVSVHLGKAVADILAPRVASKQLTVPVDLNKFYTEIEKVGYNYGPSFRKTTSMERCLGYSRGTIAPPEPDPIGTPLLFHPGVLDAALQGMLAAFSSPGDGRLRELYAPSGVERVSLVPSLCGANMTPEVLFDCTFTSTTSNHIAGDVDVYQSKASKLKSISLEGVTFVPLTAATEVDDVHLFAHTLWRVDQPDGELALGNHRATPAEVGKGLEDERFAFYHLRKLKETFPAEDRRALQLPPHLEALFDFIEHVCARVERGGVPYFQKEWLKDDATDMAALLAKYDEHDPKYSLMRAVGENLPSVIRGETTMLEHMTKDDKLGNFYRKASSHQISNNFTANIAGQIAHRYPHMDICEVGAGTGSATGGILANLGTAFASYTYTDISSGFFANAQERFAAYGSRMIYKTLDISQDPTTQGFAKASYDVVFAANVLHATPRLEETLRNVRRLLKPGGYLVLMEIIETGLFRNGFIFGGLPGWWIGRDEGRRYAPTIELHKWHSVLLNTGFSGVETATPMDDPVAREIGVFTSRAVDDDITLLRDPLSSSQSPSSERNSTLVILGGGTATTKHVVDDLVNTLEKRYKQVICASSWEELCDIEVPEGSSLLTLADCDGTAFWKNITARVFEKFKKLMLESKNVIWTTWGFDRENPDGAMTVGFFRSLVFDLPGSQLQIIDLEKPDDVESKFLAESMLRLEVTEGWRRKGIFDTKLWTTEPEIRVRKGRVLIPRVVPQRQQNDRFNSTRRDIQKDVDMRKSVVELTSTDDGKYALREDESCAVPSIPGHRRVRVTLSMLSSLATSAGRFYFGLGEDIDTGERVVSASLKNASAISVPNRWSVLVDVGKSIDAQYLSFFAGHVMSQRLASLVPPSGRLLVHEPDSGLASRVARRLSSQGSQPPLFTTSSTELLTKKRRNWFYLHPRITDRHLKASLPSHTDVYLDFSSWPTAAASEQQGTLGARIAQMTPQLCVKYDLSALITPGSVPALSSVYHEDDTVHQILKAANEFAAKQLNGVPEGMPLSNVPAGGVVGDSVSAGEPMRIIDWQAEPIVPVKVEPISNRRDLFRADGTYWLVGLAGDSGRSICDFMIDHGACQIVLTSRNPHVKEEWVQAHTDQGVKIAYLRGDVTVREDVQRIYSQIVHEMPPIIGVANGALVLQDRGLVNMDLETVHMNTRPKVEGTTYLNELFPENTLDWFIAFSSIAATTGNIGQMAYSAANLFMKALIAQRRHRGLAGSVIDISLVAGVGYVDREIAGGQMTQEQFNRLRTKSGSITMSEVDLHQLFAEAVVAGRAGSSADPELVTGIKTVSYAEKKQVLWGENVKLGHFVQDTRGISRLPGASKTNFIPVKTKLESAADAEEMRTILKDCLISKLKSSMMLSADENLSETTPLIDLGVDSLVAVEIRTWFSLELDVDMAVLKILGGVSVRDLVDEIIEKLAATKSEGEETDSGGSSTEDDSC